MRSRPWTAADAVSHNAALKGNVKLAKLWADTANGTLQSEIEEKTPQTKAEGIAIATANKAVGKKLKARAHMGNSGRPQKPVRAVAAAPGVQHSDGCHWAVPSRLVGQSLRRLYGPKNFGPLK